MAVRIHVDLGGITNAAPVSEMGRSDALARLAVRVPPHRADEKMRLARVRLLARCDRVEPARQRPQEAEELVR